MINPRSKIFIDYFSDEIPETEIYFIEYSNGNVILEGTDEESLEKNKESLFKKNLKVEDFVKCLYLIENKPYEWNSEKNIICEASTKKVLLHAQILLPIAVAIIVTEDGANQVDFGEALSDKLRSQLRLEIY